jgi:predicted dehydrogenase
MTTRIRWGILGAGIVARKFASSLGRAPGAELGAVAARDLERARSFAREYGFSKAYGSYDELALAPDIDVVYVATPNTLHRIHSLLCLESGKAVLCEKPFAVSETEAREVLDTATRRRLFCMEAMWMRTSPAFKHVRELCDRLAIGSIRFVTASLGIRAHYDPESRLWSPALGGGALLDLGPYVVSVILAALGAPRSVGGSAGVAPSGVDEITSCWFKFDGDRHATAMMSLCANMTNDAVFIGDAGVMVIHAPLYCPQSVSVRLHEHPRRGPLWKVLEAPALARLRPAHWSVQLGRDAARTVTLPTPLGGYGEEAVHVMECIRAGQTESDCVSHADTLSTMRVLDSLRQAMIR